MKALTVCLLASLAVVLGAGLAAADWGCCHPGCQAPSDPCASSCKEKLHECMEFRWEFWTKHCPRPGGDDCHKHKCKDKDKGAMPGPYSYGFGWNPYIRSPRDYFMYKP
jgi:hypothetical protein